MQPSGKGGDGCRREDRRVRSLPEATASIAAFSSLKGSIFSTIPWAPASSAARMAAGSMCPEKISTFVFGTAFLRCSTKLWVLAPPKTQSSTTISGFRRSQISGALAASSAKPTTLLLVNASIIAVIISMIAAWSSTMTIRVAGAALLEGK